MSRDKILKKLDAQHQGEEVTYLTCTANGCWDASCILRVRSKDGKVTAIEADDTINKNVAREDAYITDEEIKSGMIQHRPCVQGHSWAAELYAEDRITKPLKRVGGRGPGKGHFVEISWDEALDTIADKMKETRELFGPASMHHTHLTFFEISGWPLAPYMDGPVAAWCDHSTSGALAGEKLVLGYDPARNLFAGKGGSMVGYEAPDLFNSNLIILWGWDPLVGWHGPTSYYLKLAKERGAKIVVIDPRYTLSAEVLGDQWIPIRPGTDHAMLLAMAQVIFEEDLLNHEYIAEWVEPNGVEKFKNYLMGGEDGEVKTPEWAESICAVPAETIRELARLYATSGPVHLQLHYSVGKRHYGDYNHTAAMILQAMTGNISIPGGCETGTVLATPTHLPSMPDVRAELKQAPPEFKPPVVMANNKLAEAVYLRPKLDSGEITEEEYRRAIGTYPDAPTPNIQFVFFMNNWLGSLQDYNKRMKTAEMLHFTCGIQWHLNSPTVEFLDIVLPGPIHELETLDPYHLDAKRFRTAPGGMNNYFFFANNAVEPPEDIRPIDWIWTQLAKRLGIADKYNPVLKDVPHNQYTDELRKLYKKAYEKWVPEAKEEYAELGVELEPSWEEFLKNPVVRVPIDEPFHAFKNTLDEGSDEVFRTPSRKIEFSHERTAGEIRDLFGGQYDDIPRWKPSYQVEPPLDSYYHGRTKKYPLSLVTPVSIFRGLSKHDSNEILRDCYNHRVWLNPADAQARGLKDNDRVLVYNEIGEAIMNVFVTSKILPGTTAMHFGGWYKPSSVITEKMPYGIDTRGSCNLFTMDKHLPHIVNSVITSGLVEVEKLGGVI